MSQEIQQITSSDPALVAQLRETVKEAHTYHQAARSDATRSAYEHDWTHFTNWCQARGIVPLPAAPASIVLYITELARDRKVSTITRRLAAISQVHKERQHESPTKAAVVQNTLKGIRNKKGTAPTQKRAAEVEIVRRMVKTLDLDSLGGVRARALLLVGFAGAFRRSELASLTVADLEEVAEGLIITLRRSKTDQEGAGELKPIAYGEHVETCPVRALRAWLSAAGITEGPIFRGLRKGNQVRADHISGQAISDIIKAAAAASGYDPDDFGGHSLRSGYATTAARIGVSEKDIMDQTGHKTTTMVRRYIRRGSLFKNDATKVGL